MKHFPLYIDISHKKVLVIGGGHIAERRITTLLSFQSDITVIAPTISETLLTQVNARQIAWIQASLCPRDDSTLQIHPADTTMETTMETDFRSMVTREAPYLILAATHDRSINHGISLVARACRIPVNVCDCQEECDFYFPAIIEEDGIVASVTANGTNHRLVRSLATQIRALLRENLDDSGHST
ncbi:MAG: bifunctional precorrin-2 dehydrogenase/sirohydrochlorin ferrochelatase [Lachnospiraceae bacterium]|nr:bifunctional precorrin-2 dehydrogenase/sirohydrochlorin ferrochelatase [Lachnospiraceae bacterium]